MTVLERIVAPDDYGGFPYHVPPTEGWDIFECDGSANHTPFQLQKVDEEDVFVDDCDAWRHVVRNATNGSPLHVAALAFIAMHGDHELGYIIRYLWKEGP